VYVTCCPATGDAGLAVLVSVRSADAPPFAVDVAVLLALTGSGVVADTVAVLLTVPDPAGGVLATNDRVAVAPTASVPTGQVTVLPAAVQPSALLANVSPAGSGSEMTTPVAVEGPRFVTDIV
jgi:hypothetical protein